MLLGALPLALLLGSAAAAPGATPTSGLLYYTRYQGPAEVKKVNYYYDGGTNFGFSNSVSIVALNGADGLTVAPDGSLIIGACGNGTIDKVNPLNGSYVSVASGGGSCHLALDPNRTRAWAGFSYNGSSALSEIPLVPNFANGIAHPITGSETAVGTLAWDPAGNTYYTVSQPGGGGNFGTINLGSFVTTRLLASVPAAHGMAYDPFSGTFMLFGSTHITQVLATPTNATIIGDLTFPVSEFDQGTVDARGHLFAADTGGNMLFIDYSASGYLTNATTFNTLKFLDPNLDDVAPVGLVGSGNLADVALSLQANPNPALMRSNLVLTFTVTNLGPAAATGIAFSENLPANANLVSATASQGTVSVANNQVTCSAASLDASNSFTVTITLQPISGALVLHASVLANETDPYFPNNFVDATVPGPYACLPAPPGLISWWTGDGSPNDFAGTNNGVLHGPTGYAPGLVGGAFAFNGVSDTLQAADSLSLRPANLTLECWALFNRFDSVRSLIGKPFGGGDADSYALWVQDGVLHGYLHYTTGDGPVLGYTLNPTPGVWYHLAFTADTGSGNQVLYVNGVPVASQTSLGTIDYDNHPAMVGSDLSGNNLNWVFSGRVDEASIYNRALTPQEISSIYQAYTQGKCSAPVIVPATLPVATTNVPYSQPLTLAHASPPFSFSQQGGTVPPGLSLYGDGSFYGMPASIGAYTFGVKGTDALGLTAQSNLTLNVLPDVQAPLGLVAWWRGETNALDQLGQHNGVLNGGVTFAPGFDGYAFNFNGQNGYVETGTWSPGTRWTVEAWVNPAAILSGRHAIVSGFQSCLDWGVALQDGQFVATIRQPGGCSLPIGSGVYPQVGLWYHVAETVDGTNGIVYVNGIPCGTNVVEPNYVATTAGTRIGGSVCCGEYFAGLIDEPAVFDRALTPAEIASLFNAGVAGKAAIGPVPQITQNPLNTTASLGGSASLCAAASGTGALFYQWYQNSIPIPGATGACLNLSPLTPTSAANYYVAVGNANGTVFSATAALTVINLQTYAGVTINGIVGAQYRIDYSNDVGTPVNWTTLTTVTLPSSPYVYVDLSSAGQPKRFYRVVKL